MIIKDHNANKNIILYFNGGKIEFASKLDFSREEEQEGEGEKKYQFPTRFCLYGFNEEKLQFRSINSLILSFSFFHFFLFRCVSHFISTPFTVESYRYNWISDFFYKHKMK